MVAAVNANKRTPIIDKAFPLDPTREAVGRMAAGKQFGKIVLDVAP